LGGGESGENGSQSGRTSTAIRFSDCESKVSTFMLMMLVFVAVLAASCYYSGFRPLALWLDGPL